jgi:hypothetical protein
MQDKLILDRVRDTVSFGVTQWERVVNGDLYFKYVGGYETKLQPFLGKLLGFIYTTFILRGATTNETVL